MKMIFLTGLLLVALQATMAQSITINGNVKNEQGKPVHFVFVEDNQLKTASYTDSLGNFSIATNPNSSLELRCPGYNDALLNIANNTSVEVVLKSDGAAGVSTGTLSTAARDNTNDNSMRVSLAHKKDQVHGNKYLFEDFVHGFVTNPSDQIVYNPAYLYDYDKMEGALLLTSDNRSVAEINRDQIKLFTLYSDHDVRYDFKMVPAIDKVHYIQVLSSGKKYEIYKFTATKFVKSDYVAAGVTSHGNDYDEYVDDATYFVLNIATNQLKPLSLKKKSIKAVFADKADAISKYISDNPGDIDDAYLSKLGNYMNK